MRIQTPLSRTSKLKHASQRALLVFVHPPPFNMGAAAAPIKCYATIYTFSANILEDLFLRQRAQRQEHDMLHKSLHHHHGIFGAHDWTIVWLDHTHSCILYRQCASVEPGCCTMHAVSMLDTATSSALVAVAFGRDSIQHLRGCITLNLFSPSSMNRIRIVL